MNINIQAPRNILEDGGHTMKILLAEDDPVNRFLVEMFLKKWGYDVVSAANGTEAWDLLQQDDAPKLALLDWMMPEMDGVEICRELRKQTQRPYVYTLLLTTKAQKQDAIAGFEAGADDYVLKPFDADDLRARLRAGRRILDLQDQLIAARNALAFEATHDSLTGLSNRRSILESLERELARAQRTGTSVGVILADLDRFKQANDTYGHQAGDELLRETGRRLSRCVRGYDIVGRYGGEEFLIVMPGLDEKSAVQQVERLRRAIARDPVITPFGTIPVTASFGVAISGMEPADPSGLLRTADQALYRAKANGRNRIEVDLAMNAPQTFPAADGNCGAVRPSTENRIL